MRTGSVSVHVIAEAGVNHNGDAELAHRLVDTAADAGADAVKFQTFRAEALVTASAPKAAYQTAITEATESQIAMLKRLEMAPETHHELMDHCRERGIGFLSTPFDKESLRFLTGELGLERLKISSGGVTDGPLLLAAAQSGRGVILSTGMSTLADVESALAVLAFGYTRPADTPCRGAFRGALAAAPGRAALAEKVVLLHCTSEYPAPFDEVNLKAMATLRQAFGLPVGLSDHSAGTSVAVAAAALGAAMIEKHFTLDRSLPGPDHRASLEPAELKAMVDGVRAVEQALGDGVKAPTRSERRNMAVVRKSLVALRPVRADEPFTPETLGAKRPGSGISPMDYWDWLGRVAARDYDADELVEP